jgi:predicted phage terminase large subunit-like protein
VAGARGNLGYIVDDLSGRFTPDQWAQRVITAYHLHLADVIVAESNYGGEMVRMNIQRRDPTVNVKLVTASKGKAIRAEPVSALYEQGRVFHVRPFPELEDQLCTYTKESKDSPDRLDALVWGLQDLLLSSVTITDASIANV